jgi:hypothetical protein
VDKIVALVYTAVVEPALAHALPVPAPMVCARFGYSSGLLPAGRCGSLLQLGRIYYCRSTVLCVAVGGFVGGAGVFVDTAYAWVSLS